MALILRGSCVDFDPVHLISNGPESLKTFHWNSEITCSLGKKPQIDSSKTLTSLEGLEFD